MEVYWLSFFKRFEVKLVIISNERKTITTTIKYLEKQKNYIRSHNVREIKKKTLDGLRLTIDKE
jgi:hypothetical protein